MPSRWPALLAGVVAVLLPSLLHATPANKKALEEYLGRFRSRSVDCRLCHVPDPAGDKINLDEVDRPHNAFGKRLKALRRDLSREGKSNDIESRLQLAANEDSDGDGISNLVELLAGHNPGEAGDKPTPAELADSSGKLVEFTKFQQRYRWRPFEPVTMPPVPAASGSVSNPIDAFIDAERCQQGLSPRPEAPKDALLRRLYVDLIGLPPTREERAAFLADTSSNGYEAVVDRLLADPRHAERWARHWMDVWRYSDWAGYGKEVRDSQPHIWRWRDWIIESLHADKGYDRMVREMLAGDELAPDDPNTVRATGFLARNWFRFNRNVWLDQTVEHTSKAFLGVTLNCCRCHDHMYDPFPQTEYYAFRAFFEPHQVRTDRLPGQPNLELDGLARVYDGELNAKTFLLIRGNEASPDKDHPCDPAVPKALKGPALTVKAVELPRDAFDLDRREFVLREALTAAEGRLRNAESQMAPSRTRFGPMVLSSVLTGTVSGSVYATHLRSLEAESADAELLAAQLQVMQAKRALEQRTSGDAPLEAIYQTQLIDRQRNVAEARRTLLEARLAVTQAAPKQRKAAADQVKKAEQALANDNAQLGKPLAKELPKAAPKFPSQSTGRRLALANWITDRRNPLAARVAVNHVWLRHFGQPLVPTVFDFGKNGQPPTYPALLDWLASRFIEDGWSCKKLHKLIVMSNTYRMDSTPDSSALAHDPENRYYWRRLPQRMEAEAVRDTLLHLSGRLESTRGGPELDHEKGLTTFRRSLYYRHANEKQMVFLTTFDAAGPTECYRRVHSVVPQQALALANSSVAQESAAQLARRLAGNLGPQAPLTSFVATCFEQVLGRSATQEETALCVRFLREQENRLLASPPAPRTITERARASLVQVLFNHHEFVTVR
jgi:hypothetical protein